MDWTFWLEWFIKAVIMSLLILGGFAYLTLYERRALARIQTRIGPNRAGPQGLLQPIADAVKLIFKEEFTPARADKIIFVAAPIVTVVPAIILAAVIPLGTQFTLPFVNRPIHLYVANINVGVLYITAIASIAVYGIVLAGWSSNNKYAMLGGMRSTAQMISYELALGLSFVTVILLGNSMSMVDIVERPEEHLVRRVPAGRRDDFHDRHAGGGQPRAVRHARSRAGADRRLSHRIFGHEVRPVLHGRILQDDRDLHDHCHALLRRLPGVLVPQNTFLSVDAVWHVGPWVFNAWFLGPIYLFIKVVVLLFGMIWVRATWPRIRYDRLMSFGWKVLLPLSIAIVVLTATGVLLSDQFGPVYIWAIPVVSVFAGVIAVLLVNLSLRRRTAHA